MIPNDLLHVLTVLFIGGPQLIVCIGWFLYIYLQKSITTSSSLNIGCFDLSGVDVVIPIRDSLFKIECLLDNLQDFRRKGARIVLLDSSSGHPLPLQGKRSNTAILNNRFCWKMCETDWGTHCWGVPPPGFKAGVLNLWMQYSNSEIVIVIDSDWRVDTDQLMRLVFALRANPRLAFVQGKWAFLNDNQSWVSRADSLSLHLHHNVEQKIRASNDIHFNMNGSFTALRREIVNEVGGFDGTQLSEDVDLAFRLAKFGYCGYYDDSCEGHGRVVTDISEYRKQKVRWAAGRLQALWHHGILMITTGDFRGRLLNLHYLLEYATAPSALLLSVFSVYQGYPVILRWFAIGLILAPGFIRMLLTSQQHDKKKFSLKALSAAFSDCILRSLLSGTCLVLFVGTLFGWIPGWQWKAAKYVIICVSIILIAVVNILFSIKSDIVGLIGWILLNGILASGIILWAWPATHSKICGCCSDN